MQASGACSTVATRLAPAWFSLNNSNNRKLAFMQGGLTSWTHVRTVAGTNLSMMELSTLLFGTYDKSIFLVKWIVGTLASITNMSKLLSDGLFPRDHFLQPMSPIGCWYVSTVVSLTWVPYLSYLPSTRTPVIRISIVSLIYLCDIFLSSANISCKSEWRRC
jgi:hypothetical protein